MNLNTLPKIKAYSKDTKRRGKGVGSGNGKTAGRGHKGGKARSGYSPAPCCSGIPYYRHLPIRGFSNYRFRTEYEVVNLDAISDLNVESIDKKILFEKGLIRSEDSLVKVLGSGEISRKISITVDRFSESAKNAIESVGGQAIALINNKN